MTRLAVAAAILTVAASLQPTTPAGADSFTPVRLSITVAPVARLHKPLRVTVAVSADPGVLDTRTAPLRIQAKLASECGGTFEYTAGPVLIDKQLDPQPTTGRAYTATVRSSGRPKSYGIQTLCVWLNEQGDGRTFASDQATAVDVSRSCTRAAARYDKARRRLLHARRSGHGVAGARKRRTRARRAALHACGRGVPL